LESSMSEAQEQKTPAKFAVEFGRPTVTIVVKQNPDTGKYVDGFRVKVRAAITMFGKSIEDWHSKSVFIDVRSASEDEIVNEIISAIDESKKVVMGYWGKVYKAAERISAFADVQIEEE